MISLTLPGPSRTIIVEPVEEPAAPSPPRQPEPSPGPEPEEPAPERERPSRKPRRSPSASPPGPEPARQNAGAGRDSRKVRRIPRSPCCPDLLAPDRVLPVHRLPLARAHIEAERELRRLVAHPLAILVDGRLVIPTPSRRDPGGFPV